LVLKVFARGFDSCDPCRHSKTCSLLGIRRCGALIGLASSLCGLGRFTGSALFGKPLAFDLPLVLADCCY
jgi:hypothetical protein